MLQKLYAVLRQVAKQRDYKQQGPVLAKYLKVGFKNKRELMTHMFEVRKWYIMNSPDSNSANTEKYTGQMSVLHNELNYQQSKVIMKRFGIVFLLVLLYTNFFFEFHGKDWNQEYNLSYQKKLANKVADSLPNYPTQVEEDQFSEEYLIPFQGYYYNEFNQNNPDCDQSSNEGQEDNNPYNQQPIIDY